MLTDDTQISISQNLGFLPVMKLGLQRLNPDEETINWRAVCGRTARTVRREGRFLPYPYQKLQHKNPSIDNVNTFMLKYPHKY
jgi:hypothetical protein